jgi:hypothetical protein
MITDETLIAYLDGELDPHRSAELSIALATDTALAERLDQHRAAADQVRAFFGQAIAEPVPERLQLAVAGADNVVGFHPRPRPVRHPVWWGAAAAASLAVGVFLGRSLPSDTAWVDQDLATRGALTTALDRQLSGDAGAVQIGLTFRSTDGAFCRTFSTRQGGSAGLACRTGAGWRVRMMAPAAAKQDGPYRMAASPVPAQIAALAQSLADGPALDRAQEAMARRNGWK